MYSRSLLRSILPVLGLILAFVSLSYAAAPPNRIQSVGAEDNGAPLPYSVSPRVKKATDLGIEPGSRVLDTLMLRFSRTPAQQAALDQLLIDQQNPSSPRYHQWLTPEQFGAQFGLSSDDIAKVSNWLTTQGFTVTGVARSSTFITFKGTVAQAQRAFHTSIHSLNLNGEQHFANTTDIALPASIASVVSAVSGLDNFKLKTQARVRTASPNVLNPQYTSSVSQQHFIAPGDFNTIYNVTPLLKTSIDGSGYSIAIMGQVDLSTADVSAFRKASGLSDYCFVTPTSNPCSGSTLPIFTTTVYGTDPGAATSSTSTPSTGDLAEAQLDVEWAGAVAPKANIIFVNSKNVLYVSMLNAIDDKLAPIISISYGLCEPAATVSDLDSFNQYFQQANAEGITIVGPSGDSGATECDYNTTTATQGFAVGFPASSPFVTSMGGTMFKEGSDTGATSYWNGGNSDNSGSAIKYIPETVWNESGSNGLGAGGGGSSAFFSKPYWQVTPGVTNDYARDVPDVSLNSASGHDGYLFCLQGSCTNGGYRNSAGNLSVVGGTSVAAPAFAGILALVEQQNHLTGIGNANPVLYALGSTTGFNDVFHDIDNGNNFSPCEIGTPDCPNGGSIGYNAVAGYDKATGWGSIDASNLANKWMAAVPVVGTSPVGPHISATSLTTTSSICGLSGASLALTATVTNDSGTSGATPTGTVQFLVDNVAVGHPVALAGGSATYSLDTSAFSSGGHTVSAAYSGDGTYAGSRGTLLVPNVGLTPIDVISTTNPDFSITPCSTTTSAKSGATAPGITLTFAPVNGFTGTISLAVSSNQAVTASYAFTPASTPADTITLNSNSPTSVTFTLSAFQSSAKNATSLLKMASNHPNATKTPWYIAGSGATLACMFLLVLPRRRRWGALFAVILSVGVIGGATGCGGSGGSTSSSTSGGSATTPVITPAAAGNYRIDITAVAAGSSGNVVHHVTVLFNVQ